MFYLSPTLFSIIEVLLVILPVLIGVAFVTVAERKTMASMQRRLGPNIVGYYGLLQAFNKQQIKRTYHTSCKLYNSSNPEKWDSIPPKDSMYAEAVKALYKDRIASVKPFDENLILGTCLNYLDLKEKAIFLDEWGLKAGIYLIQYKHDPLIYYIGRTNQFKTRFKYHVIRKSNDKFHVFANLVG